MFDTLTICIRLPKVLLPVAGWNFSGPNSVLFPPQHSKYLPIQHFQHGRQNNDRAELKGHPSALQSCPVIQPSTQHYRLNKPVQIYLHAVLAFSRSNLFFFCRSLRLIFIQLFKAQFITIRFHPDGSFLDIASQKRFTERIFKKSFQRAA